VPVRINIDIEAKNAEELQKILQELTDAVRDADTIGVPAGTSAVPEGPNTPVPEVPAVEEPAAPEPAKPEGEAASKKKTTKKKTKKKTSKKKATASSEEDTSEAEDDAPGGVTRIELREAASEFLKKHGFTAVRDVLSGFVTEDKEPATKVSEVQEKDWSALYRAFREAL